MYNLDTSAFKLWIYFADNANGYFMDLYPVDFCSRTQLSKSTYDRAFKRLEDKGYLIKSTKQNNLYLFK
jgi:DNA-binding MarR family transcriptional regulator